MKTRTIPLLLLLTAVALHSPFATAQGTLYFSNRALPVGLDAPIFMPDGSTLARDTDTALAVMLYVAPVGQAPVQATPAFSTLSDPGYWRPFVLTLPGTAPGTTLNAEVRAWSLRQGPDFATVAEVNGLHGTSLPFQIVLGGDTQGGTQPPSLPSFLTGLPSIRLTGTLPPIPEPRTVGLVLLGALALALAPRRITCARTKKSGHASADLGARI